MNDYLTGIANLFNNNSLEGIPLIAAGLLFFMGVYFFAPKLRHWALLLRRRRNYWAYQAMVGLRMSKRAKDIQVSEKIYDILLDLVKQGVLTHKDKRKYLRVLELAFDLEPGLIRPKPNGLELKRKIRSRLSAKSANIISLSPRRRLAALIASKG